MPIPVVVTLPKYTGAALGSVGVALQVPLLWTLFIDRDSVRFNTAMSFFGLAFYFGVAGLVFAVRKDSRLGIFMSALSLGGIALFWLVFIAIANAFGEG